MEQGASEPGPSPPPDGGESVPDEHTSAGKAEPLVATPAPSPPTPTFKIAPRPPPPATPKLPGVNYMTRATGSANIGPVGESWKKRAGRLVSVMWNTKTQKEFKPFLEEAQEWLEGACMQLALSAGGVCGPIEMNALATAAWQTAYARYWMHMAAENPADLKLFETASRVADAARSNSLAAYDIAVRLARSKPSSTDDPLAALIDVTAPSPALSPAPPPKGFADDEED